MSDASKKFAIAEHRQAYAAWCGKSGVKQNHAVFVSTPDRLLDRKLDPAQFVFVDGWEKNPRHIELLNAYGAAVA